MSAYIPPHPRGKPQGGNHIDAKNEGLTLGDSGVLSKNNEELLAESSKSSSFKEGISAGTCATPGDYKAFEGPNQGHSPEETFSSKASILNDMIKAPQGKLQEPAWRAPKKLYDRLWNPDLMKPKPDERAVGTLLKSLTLDEIDLCEPAAIKNCNHLASFSLVGSYKSPAVVIPGISPAWVGPPEDRVQWDEASVFRDTNAPYSPGFSMHPSVEAILETSNIDQWKSMDVVTCSSVLINLLKFAEAMERSFRFDVGVVADTTFFVRREKTPFETGNRNMGYGQNFNRACTGLPEDLQNTTTHCRIVEYDFGGMNIALRANVHGYVQTNTISSMASKPVTKTGVRHGLNVTHGGLIVPQSTLFDSKTRSKCHREPPNITEITRRLWAKQIFRCLVGIHDRGQFNNVSIRDMHEHIVEWERENAEALGRLAAVIREIINACFDVRKRGASGNLEVVRVDGGPLEIPQKFGEERPVLSKEMSARWKGESA